METLEVSAVRPGVSVQLCRGPWATWSLSKLLICCGFCAKGNRPHVHPCYGCISIKVNLKIAQGWALEARKSPLFAHLQRGCFPVSLSKERLPPVDLFQPYIFGVAQLSGANSGNAVGVDPSCIEALVRLT